MDIFEYLVQRRRIILFDEWGFYLCLTGLFTAYCFKVPFAAILFGLAATYGITCLAVSYRSFWKLEDMVIEHLKKKLDGGAAKPSAEESCQPEKTK